MDLLEEPRTMEDIIEAWIIYGKPREPKIFYELGERGHMKKHLERLARVRRERDNRELNRKLKDLKHAARGKDNLMPYIMEAVRAYGTLGEICDVMRGVFGEYKAPALF